MFVRNKYIIKMFWTLKTVASVLEGALLWLDNLQFAQKQEFKLKTP